LCLAARTVEVRLWDLEGAYIAPGAGCRQPVRKELTYGPPLSSYTACAPFPSSR
jgi:hypothetical protein